MKAGLGRKNEVTRERNGLETYRFLERYSRRRADVEDASLVVHVGGVAGMVRCS